MDNKQREIKFRFWSVAGMHDVESIDFKNSLVFLSDGDERQLDSGTLMQYTGLKDKNGKEIYEGDIVCMSRFIFEGEEVEKDHTGIMSYGTESASYHLTNVVGDFYSTYTGYEEGEDEEGTPLCFFGLLDDGSFEIIGNMYENPELLSD